MPPEHRWDLLRRITGIQGVLHRKVVHFGRERLVQFGWNYPVHFRWNLLVHFRVKTDRGCARDRNGGAIRSLCVRQGRQWSDSCRSRTRLWKNRQMEKHAQGPRLCCFCTNSVTHRNTLKREYQSLGIPGRATDLRTVFLTSKDESPCPLWLDEWK